MADKFFVNSKTTLHAGREVIPAGAEVDKDKLGLTKKAFDKLVEDGTIVKEKGGKAPAPEQSKEAEK